MLSCIIIIHKRTNAQTHNPHELFASPMSNVLPWLQHGCSGSWSVVITASSIGVLPCCITSANDIDAIALHCISPCMPWPLSGTWYACASHDVLGASTNCYEYYLTLFAISNNALLMPVVVDMMAVDRTCIIWPMKPAWFQCSSPGWVGHDVALPMRLDGFLVVMLVWSITSRKLSGLPIVA